MNGLLPHQMCSCFTGEGPKTKHNKLACLCYSSQCCKQWLCISSALAFSGATALAPAWTPGCLLQPLLCFLNPICTVLQGGTCGFPGGGIKLCSTPVSICPCSWHMHCISVSNAASLYTECPADSCSFD